MFNYFVNGWSIPITHAPSFKAATDLQNYRAARVVFQRYVNLALNRVSFDGCPPTISERVLRESLLWYPLTAFFVVGDSTIALPATPGGKGWNAYGDFGSAYAFARNGKNYLISTNLPGETESSFLKDTIADYKIDAVYKGCLIRCNDACNPFINTVIFYTEQVCELIRAMEVSRILLKHPVGIGTSMKQRSSQLKLLKDINDNYPFILLNQTGDARNPIQAQAIDLMNGGDVIKPTMEAIDWWENRFLAENGTPNAGSQVDKKGENMTIPEVHSSDAVTSAVINILVDFYNEQIENNGLRELPGCQGLTCKPGKAVDDGSSDVRSVHGSESDDMAGNSSDDNGAD